MRICFVEISALMKKAAGRKVSAKLIGNDLARVGFAGCCDYGGSE